MIKVALVDDEALFRKGLKLLIQNLEDIQVTLEASNGRELMSNLKNATEEIIPDVILLDMNMPVMDGLETTKALKQFFPEINIVILSSHFKKSFVLYMLELGVSSYISKDTDINMFEIVIREVKENGFYYSNEVLQIINKRLTGQTKKSDKSYFEIDLTKRELAVLTLICNQYTTKEIGKELFISPRTVEGHRNKLIEKIGCRNIAGLVSYAIQNGLIDLSGPPRFNR